MRKRSILTLFAPGKMAGAEKVVSVGFNHIKRLDLTNQHHLTLIQEKNAPEYASDFANVIEEQKINFLKSESAFDLKLILELRKLIKDLKIDVIHTHGYKSLFYASLVKFTLGGTTKLVHTHHGNTGHTKKVIFYEKLALLLMRLCNQVICLSPIMERQLRENKISALTEVHNMYSLPPSNEEISPPKDEVSSFLYLGRLSPEKNPETLLESFKRVSATCPQLELHMVGDGPLAAQLKEAYSCHNIHFHGHIAEPTKIKKFIEESDYLCLPSLSEGMPMTVIEALCLGRPILANKVGALEYMLTQDNSFLIDIDENGQLLRNNLEMLANRWVEILEAALKSKKGNYAWENREKEREKYSAQKWVDQTKAVYQKLNSNL